MRINLPIDILRSFVTIVDTGSMVRASEHVFLTQSALSLQMKRLADIMQQPLFLRQQGRLLLTPAGENLLAYAREMLALNDRAVGAIGGRRSDPIRIGMVQDFADAILTNVLVRFKRLMPGVRMEVRIARSSEIAEQGEAGLLDIGLYLSEDISDATLAVAPMAWFGPEDLLASERLPVALMNKPCLFRDVAVAALESAGQPYYICVETPSLSVLRAAVESGLAVTCRTGAFLGAPRPPLSLNSVALPKVGYNMFVRDHESGVQTALADLLKSAMISL